MANPQEDKKQPQTPNESLKPDPETLHKTDPQENMTGPISSLIQGIKEEAETNDKESKEEADQQKEEKM